MIVYRARTLLACIVCCILGCATPYRPPVDGPTASVRFVNESGLAGKVTSYADEECNKGAHSGELAALGVEPDKKETTVVVAANRPLIFTFLTGSRGGPLGIAGWENMNCSMTLRFVPEESVQYNITYARAGNKCEPVASAANSAGTSIPVELQFNPNFCPRIY